MLTYPKNFESSITVIGENGTMKISGSKFENIEHTEFKNIQLDLNQQYNQVKLPVLILVEGKIILFHL